MDDYVAFLYNNKIEEIIVENVPAISVGYFVILKMDDLNRVFPDIQFRHRQSGPHLKILNSLYENFLKKRKSNDSYQYGMLYDFNPEYGGDARIFTRFYKGNGVPQSTEYEAQCGTGTIAVALAMEKRQELPCENKILFEWGSKKLTNDPYGERKTLLEFERYENKLMRASFSHNIIELQSVGELYLPSFNKPIF